MTHEYYEVGNIESIERAKIVDALVASIGNESVGVLHAMVDIAKREHVYRISAEGEHESLWLDDRQSKVYLLNERPTEHVRKNKGPGPSAISHTMYLRAVYLGYDERPFEMVSGLMSDALQGLRIDSKELLRKDIYSNLAVSPVKLDEVLSPYTIVAHSFVYRYRSYVNCD